MYQISNSLIISFLFFFFLLLSCSGYAHARPILTSNEGLSGEQMMTEKQEVNDAGWFTEVADFKDLIGEEDAYQKRRMIDEAHLDYIYTQTHKP